MADDLKQRGGQDRTRIDIGQSHELRSWAEKFGVSHDELKQAVEAVGDNAAAVERHLKSGRKGAKRTDDPMKDHPG